MQEREVLIEELSKLDTQTLAMAYVYAKNLTMFGVDVVKEWETVVQQSSDLYRAYSRGVDDGYKKGIAARGSVAE